MEPNSGGPGEGEFQAGWGSWDLCPHSFAITFCTLPPLSLSLPLPLPLPSLSPPSPLPSPFPLPLPLLCQALCSRGHHEIAQDLPSRQDSVPSSGQPRVSSSEQVLMQHQPLLLLLITIRSHVPLLRCACCMRTCNTHEANMLADSH